MITSLVATVPQMEEKHESLLRTSMKEKISNNASRMRHLYYLTKVFTKDTEVGIIFSLM